MKASPELAIAHLVAWRHATSIQALRVLNPAAAMLDGPATREADTTLFALALRNLVRSVVFVRSSLPEKRRASVDEALATFDQAVPNAKHIRDVLEHFDKYSVGTGNLQKKVKAKVAQVLWHEWDGTDQVLKIGIVGQPGPFALNVRIASEAASELASSVISVVFPPRPMPGSDLLA